MNVEFGTLLNASPPSAFLLRKSFLSHLGCFAFSSSLFLSLSLSLLWAYIFMGEGLRMCERMSLARALTHKRYHRLLAFCVSPSLIQCDYHSGVVVRGCVHRNTQVTIV